MVKAADAIALFSAYTALIAIATVYQTLALQALATEGDRLDADIERRPQQAFAGAQHASARRLLLKTVVVIIGTAAIVFLLAAWSDETAMRIDPSDGVPQSALLNATLLLRAVFVATCVAFAWSVFRHDLVADLRRKRL